MKYLKESSKRKKIITIVIVVVLLLAIVAVALLTHLVQAKSQTNGSSPIESNQQSELSENVQGLSDNNNVGATDNEPPVVFEEEALESIMADGIVISTPIGELYYSKVWEEYTEVKYNSDERNFTATIQANIGNHKSDILAIHLCDEADGMIIGTVPDSEGNQIKVFLELYEIDTSNDWSQAEIDTVYAMQEGINQIIEQISQLYGYVPT